MKRPKGLIVIFLTMLMDVIGVAVIIPIVPKLLETLLHKGVEDASIYGAWLVFVYALMQFLFSPVLGGLSDCFGRRRVLLVSILGISLDFLLQAKAPTIAWLFVGRILAGIAGASFTTANAYISDVSTKENKAQNFGLVGMAFGVGFIVGPLIGGFFAKYGERVPFYVSAILAFINFICCYFFLPESLPKEKRRPFDWKRANPIGSLMNIRRYKSLANLMVALMFIYIANHALQSTWTFYTMYKFGWNERTIGISLAVIGTLVMLVQGGLVRFIIPALGMKKSIIVGLSINVIGLLLMSLASNGLSAFLCIGFYCLGGISNPAIQGYISNVVSDNEQGELQGGITSLMGLSSIIGPLLMNNLFYHFSQANAPILFPGMPFAVASFLALIALLLVLFQFRKSK